MIDPYTVSVIKPNGDKVMYGTYASSVDEAIANVLADAPEGTVLSDTPFWAVSKIITTGN